MTRSRSDTHSPRRRRRDAWRVVIAEDNDDHALLIEMALERASQIPVQTMRAHNGDEAVELIGRERPDLILLDLRMPGRDGHEVLQSVKADEELRKIPIAVLTSSDRDDDIARSYGLGGNHFLTKPDNPQELETRLRALLKNVDEMSGIRRGVEGLQASARSAGGAGEITFRRWLPLMAFGVAIVILLVFALVQGAL